MTLPLNKVSFCSVLKYITQREIEKSTFYLHCFGLAVSLHPCGHLTLRVLRAQVVQEVVLLYVNFRLHRIDFNWKMGKLIILVQNAQFHNSVKR